MPVTGSDSYIIRVYRRSKGKPAQIIGVVEQVHNGRKTPFHNIEELWKVLASGRSRSSEALDRNPPADLKAEQAD